MKEKLIKRIYNYYEHNYKGDKNKLLESIKAEVEKGEEGAQNMIDWCCCEYDECREKYAKIHNLSEEEMDEIMEEHGGSYEFMDCDIDYIAELDDIWDICNWFLDYTQDNHMSEEDLLRLLDNGISYG